MVERFFRLRLCIILLSVKNLSSQVDDFRMRYEQDYARLKQQEVALIPQRVYSFSKTNTQHLHTNIHNVLNDQTSLYISRQSIYQSDIHYQNRKTSPSIAIQNVDFNATILENNLQFIQTVQPLSFESIQIYQGYSIAQLTTSGSQIALNYPVSPSKRDSFGTHINAIAGGGTSDYTGMFQLALHRKKLNYVLNAYGGQNFRYELGSGTHNWLTWQRTANPFNGAGLGSWTYKTDTLVNTLPQIFVGIDNLIQLKLMNQNEWNFYLHMEGRQESSLGQTIQKRDNYLLSESTTEFQPVVLAFVQKVNYSESSPFFSQLNLAFAYQHLTQHTNKRYDIQGDTYRQHYGENKFSLQARAYKNFNAKHILFYGSEFSAAFIKNEYNRDDLYTTFFDKPITKFTSYIQFEKRQSADISWHIGARGGFENISFSHPPFYPTKQSILRPHGEFNVSWQRHICESSNYAINLFLRSKAPNLTELNPLFNQVYLVPNTNLKNETELLFESHIYRKFEDRFEMHLSPYFRYSWNTILLRDNYGNSNEKIQFGPNEFFRQQYTHQSHLAEGGANLELKYNISKKFLLYYQINWQHVWTSIDSSLWYPSIPIFGNSGFKYKSNKLFIHYWLRYNLGKTFGESVRSQYIQYYALQDGTQKKFPAYVDLNLSIRYQLAKNISAQLNIENISDQNSIDFLSTLPNQGRRFRLQLMYSL